MLTYCRGLVRRPLGPALVWITAVAASTGSAAAAARTHYLIIYNDAALPVSSVEVAPHGTEDYHRLATEEPLSGGRIAHTTTAYPDGVCSVDLRVTYPGSEPSMTITAWDLCGHRTIHLGMARRAADVSPTA